MIVTYNQSGKKQMENEKTLAAQLNEVNKKIERLEERFVLEEIPQELFKKFKYNKETDECRTEEENEFALKITNQSKSYNGSEKNKGGKSCDVAPFVEQNYTKSNKFIRDFEKIVEYIRSFPEVREFLNDEGDVATRGT